jgi:CelD/BcsL family acetyltransferase involved in cellulose biosynthesis
VSRFAKLNGGPAPLKKHVDTPQPEGFVPHVVSLGNYPGRMISVHVLEGRAALEAIADEWETLAGDSYAKVFSHPGWYLAWLDAFPTEKVAAVTARSANRLVGVLPLAKARTDARGLYFRLLGPIARGDYQPPIIAPEVLAEALPAMLDAGFRYFGRRGVFWWPNLPVSEPSYELLRSFFESRRMPWKESREDAPRLRLDGRDFEVVEKDWASSHRRDLHRQHKRLAAERGPVSLWVPSSIEEAEPVLADFFRVHDEKWLAQGFPGMFQNPREQTFFRSGLRRLFGRGLHFSTLRCGDTDVSYQFGFFAGGWLQWYRPSYRTEFGVYSPSKIHIGMLVEEACRSGWKGVDFLLGEEPYKNLWANDLTTVASFHAGFQTWAPSYFWFTQGKPWVKKHLARAYVDAKVWLQKRRKEA